MDSRPELSVCMIVRDEERHLAAALESVEPLAREIVVVDTGSTDRTPEIAMSHPRVRLLRETFVDFSQAKSRALEAASERWVLVLDGDERVSPELADRIRAIVAGDPARAFRVRRRNHILGRVMTSMGLQKDYPLRLFPRAGARYDGNPVHEGIEVPHPIDRLEEPLEHYTFSGIDHYLRKVDLYTTLDLSKGDREFSAFHLVFVLPSTFWRYYVARGGWRDGFPGFLWASLTAIGRFLRDMKLWVARGSG